MGDSKHSVIAHNRKARFDYSIDDVYEAGLVLTGTEVKSLRTGRVSIQDGYASVYGGEIFLHNVNIPEYAQGNRHNHPPTRSRKCLLHKRQVLKLIGILKTKGITLIPLSLYFNARGVAKVELGVAKGRKLYEKRDVIKQREWKKEQSQLLKPK